MHTLHKYSWLLILFLSATFVAQAQTQAEWIKAAEESFNFGDYYSAAFYYEEALDYDSTDHDLRFRLGESHLRYRNYERALEAFAHLDREGATIEFPRTPYLQGKAEQPLGNYDSAIDHFNRFLASPGDASAAEIADARRQITNAAWAKEEYAQYEQEVAAGLQAAIAPINYADVNTRYDDFGPQFEKDQFYFSSLRYRLEGDAEPPANKAGRILQRDAEGDLALVRELPATINQKDRTTVHTAFNAAGTMVYFTYCQYVQDTLSLTCDIYVAPVGDDGKWGTPERLSLNQEQANDTQPNVGKQADGREFLYFSSNRTGGAGGYDLYRAELLEDGEMGTVEALTDLNTSFDEVTPFYYAPKRELYFSTDGRNTLGGLDVYRATRSGMGWMEPVHLGLPTNSSYNDVYYTRYEDHDWGYFASNRHAADAIFWDEDEDVCCNDIYMVEIEKICFELTTWHAITRNELNGTTVTFYEVFPDGERLEIAQEVHPNDNLYTFEVEKNRQYEIAGTKRGFTKDETELDLTVPQERASKADCITRELYLAPPKIILEVFTFNKRDSTELNGCTVELLSRDTDSQPLVSLAEDTKEESNFYSYEIFVEKYYETYGSKPEYTSDSAMVDTRGIFIEKDTVIRRNLYLELPMCAVEPTVFFHNDRPIKDNPHTLTRANYMDTYNTYVGTHKPRYYRVWGDVSTPEQSATVRTALLDAYFEGLVDQGAEDLKAFAAQLLTYLEGGGNLTVTLQGFASPLSNGPYNDKLSARRCVSVINYLWAYQNGALRPYMGDAVILFNNKAGEEAQRRGIQTHPFPRTYKGMPVIKYQTEDAPAQSGKALIFDIKPGGEVPVNPETGLVDTGDDSIYNPVAGAARYVEVKLEGCEESSPPDGGPYDEEPEDPDYEQPEDPDYEEPDDY